MNKEWESVIGLEVHVQLSTESKIFSNAPTKFGQEQNSQASLVDLGLPGVLPVLNEKTIEMAIKFGCAIDAEISSKAIFARKNYFYPDLPKGYQISQLDDPIVGKGKINVEVDNKEREIGITRAHLEEDAGKSLHDKYEGFSAIDLNRAGTPLLEIVSEPDLRSAKEAVAYLKKIHSIITFLDISDGDMSQGSMRCDANVSIRKFGDKRLGNRTELKNINSFRFVEKAINHEINRQIELIENGTSIEQETRLYDANKNETRSMRSKEHANDYRYFPDPDLIPIKITNEKIQKIKESLPELPEQKIIRFMEDYEISNYESKNLNSSKELSHFFEIVADKVSSAELAAKWILGDLMAILNKNNLNIKDSKISSTDMIDLLKKIEEGSLSGPGAKKIIELSWTSEESIDDLVKKEGLDEIKGEDEIIKIIDEIIKNNSKQYEQYIQGKEKLFGFFVGQVMKETKGSADPKKVNELLSKKLKQ
ncbi:Asp-tRNA(Asn)/Glu-tRNA(Gln) amidotransferase subunit GatB [Gammaproteobacteria bacterium]|nr:Asp-tRNA(Asn)/Glu-tRNA(Gln) amidotransferase subunit GatB [Gammaproteobacteria bacterium]